jgi:metal transporter CNNM
MSDSTDDSDPQSILDFMSDLMDSFFTRIEILDGGFTDFEDAEDIANTIMAFACVVCAGLAAGLTMGLLSLDVTKLEIKQMTGNDAEKSAAGRLLPIIKQHHRLLVTLLLFNSIANEALPIFLGALVPNYLAVILSVVLILVFGEILPSAFFTGPQQLITASKMSNFVWGLMWFFSPVSFPVAKILDFAFGSDEDNHRDGKLSRAELEGLMLLQSRSRQRSNSSAENDGPAGRDGSGSRGRRPPHQQNDYYHAIDASPPPLASPEQHDPGQLHPYEINILTGILSLSHISVGDCMIPAERVYSLESKLQLNSKLLGEILASGFSRIPIFKNCDDPQNRNKVWLGYLLTKTLIVPSEREHLLGLTSVLREPLFVRPSLGLPEMLSLFRKGRCHIAMVSLDPISSLLCMREGRPCEDERTEVLGIVTLEDVIEKILQHDILDETDVVDTDLSGTTQPSVLYHGFHRSSSSSQRDNSATNIRRAPMAIEQQSEAQPLIVQQERGFWGFLWG